MKNDLKLKDIRMLREYVLVRPVQLQEKKIGSVIIPGSRKQEMLPGVVLRVGTGLISDDRKKHFPLEVKEGDKILYSEWAGKEIYVEGERLLIMEEQDIHLAYEEEQTP